LEEGGLVEHIGGCHCGRITISLRDTPVEASECNCSVCRRIAGLWHYCSPDLVRVEGAGRAYTQGDRALDLWHCGICGCTTHWTATDATYPRMGVNLRMLALDVWIDLPRRLVDGASY
jgi:hypothetical protein